MAPTLHHSTPVTTALAILALVNLVALGVQATLAIRSARRRRQEAANAEARKAAEAMEPPAPPDAIMNTQLMPFDEAGVRALLSEVDEAAQAFRDLMDRRLRTFSDLVDDAARHQADLDMAMRRAERVTQMLAQRMHDDAMQQDLGRYRFREAEKMVQAGRTPNAVARELGLQQAEVELAAALARSRAGHR